MPHKHSILACLAPALLIASFPATAPGAPPPNDARKNSERINIAEILQPGTEMLGMTVPRYDALLHLTSVVHAARVVLVEEGRVEGEDIDVRIFDSATRSCLGHVRLTRGTFSQSASTAAADGRPFRPALERVRADGPSVGTLEQMKVTSNGVHLTIEQPPATDESADPPPKGRMEGFLFGPVTIRIAPKPQSDDMQTSLRHFTAATLAATALAGQPDDTSPPPAPPQPPAAEPAPASQPATGAGLRAVLEESERTTRRVKEYLEMEDLMERATATQLQLPEPVEFKAGENDTRISCDGGGYFDVRGGVVVLMGGVVVDDPAFKASGIDKLEMVFKKKEKPPEDGSGKPAAKWELQRLVATGAVRFIEKLDEKREDDPDAEPPVEASGALFTYELSPDKEPDIATLSGGRPWIKRGESAQRAKKAEQVITFSIDKQVVMKNGKETIKRSVGLAEFITGAKNN